MDQANEKAALRIVMTPDVLAKSFLDTNERTGGACRGVLELWRDGRIQLVVTRPLLFMYLRVLRGLGVPDKQLRRWLLWFTEPERTVALLDPEAGALRYDDVTRDAASRGAASCVVSARAGTIVAAMSEGVECISAGEFVARDVRSLRGE